MRPGEQGISVAIEGASGVGKSTVTRLLGRRPGAVRLEEAWDRLTPKPSLELGRRRDLLALELRLLEGEAARYIEAREQVANGRVVWMDTGTLGPLTYSAGLARLTGGSLDLLPPLVAWAVRSLRAGRWGLPDLLLRLELPLPQLLARGIRSGRHPPALLARHLLVARFEQEIYRSGTAGSLRRRVLVLPARGSPEQLARAVERAVHDRARDRPPTPRAIRSVLRAIVRAGSHR